MTIHIVGERGLVSKMLQDSLRQQGIDFTVQATQNVIGRPLTDELLFSSVVVLATQDFQSEAVMEALPGNKKVLDISPTFRTHPDWVYGMQELPGAKAKISTARLVANPGCFATSAILLLYPLIRDKLIDPNTSLYLDGTGGYSTGGSKMIDQAQRGILQNDAVYSLTRPHRHIGEIESICKLPEGNITFTPKIAHTPRGIRMQISLSIPYQEALSSYTDYYRDTSIIVSSELPSRIPLIDMVGSNTAKIYVYPMGKGCLVICTMDNMTKGSVTTAVSNIKLMASL